MGEAAIIYPPTWPDMLKPATAAAMLDMSASTWRAIWPVLAARHGLKVFGVCGPKFSRVNVLQVFGSLAEKGLDLQIDRARNVVRLGNDEFPMERTATGKSGRGRGSRGRPPKLALAATVEGTKAEAA